MPELQLDGLVGLTHNYAGLSPGNVASQSNRASASHPRKAALQGLDKMRAVAALGVPQGFLPPHERPHIPTLRSRGFGGSDGDVLGAARRDAPHLLAQACSASAMWTANAATVVPSADSSDGALHLVVANLSAMPHRSIEPPTTHRMLKAAFGAIASVHAPVAGGGDEGAANHIRLTASSCAGAEVPGTHVFVYGTGDGAQDPRIHPARQHRRASVAVAAAGCLPPNRTVLLRQSPDAIDAGCFHNDVASVGNGNVLLAHERAFADPDALARLRSAAGETLVAIVVSQRELPLADAVSTYLFNSQLLTRPDGRMTMVAPAECGEHEAARAALARITDGTRSPIDAALLLDVRESMRNGGGPACLRLRVPLTGEELERVHPGFRYTPERDAWLRAWVCRHYPETLTPDDLADPTLLRRGRDALDELTQWMGTGPLYEFQLGAR